MYLVYLTVLKLRQFVDETKNRKFPSEYAKADNSLPTNLFKQLLVNIERGDEVDPRTLHLCYSILHIFSPSLSLSLSSLLTPIFSKASMVPVSIPSRLICWTFCQSLSLKIPALLQRPCTQHITFNKIQLIKNL